ncbi:MAG: hypothetical protein JWN71_3365 [Xanthobacteraceae bacterium]|nr:hypothetical protein [Xanthobacteraceae bacterium]
MNRTFAFRFQNGSTEIRCDVTIERTIVAGWTGRDPVAVEKHIKELELLGVKRPATTPIFYRVSNARLTTDPTIEAIGDTSGGEVEFLMLRHGGKWWVGAGSDHTDREVEAYGVTVSKQLCEKPISPLFWAYDDVSPHWDKLLLRSYVGIGADRALYQEGPITKMMDPMALIARYVEGGKLPDNSLMFCGTLAAIGGIRATDEFEFEIEDPVLSRKITHSYRVEKLPILG